MGYGRVNAYKAVLSALPTISGPLDLCDEATYTIASLPAGATVNWSIDGWPAEISSVNGSGVTVSRLGTGEFKVKATVTTACGSIELQTATVTAGFLHFVRVTDVSNDGMGTGSGVLCSYAPGYDNYYNTFSYEVDTYASGIQYPLKLHYMLLGPYGTVYHLDSTSISSASGTIILPNSIPAGFCNLEVWLSGGACSEESEWWEEGVDVQDCGSYARFSAYPNPANTELKIGYIEGTLENETKKKKATGMAGFSVKLLNEKGSVLKEGSSIAGGQLVTLSVEELPNGIYYLHIYEGRRLSRQQVIIEH